MHDDFRHHAEQEEAEEAECESEACPVVSVLHHFQTITIEVNLSSKIHFVEGLHRDLVMSTVLDLILLLVKGEVVFDGTAWKFDLIIFARAEA